jgi:K+ transporter
MEPHRGTTILVLGILSFIICPICGIIAWVMGNKDIPKMEAHTMDPEGLGQAKAGKICGIISVILWALGIIAYIGFFVLFIGAAASQGAFEAIPAQ